MYSISIYDTKSSRRRELEGLLKNYFYEKGSKFVIRGFSSSAELIRASGHTDIAFLSADEGDEEVIGLWGNLLSRNPHVYLYILSEKYSFLDEAMDHKVFRYFKHPVDRCRLYASLDVILEKPVKISFVSDYLPVTLSEDEIVCIYTSDRKTCVLTDSGGVYPTTSSLKEWLLRTENCRNFACPHYGYIVNMKYIRDFNGESVLLKCKTGKAVTVYPSQRRINEFRNKFYSRNRE